MLGIAYAMKATVEHDVTSAPMDTLATHTVRSALAVPLAALTMTSVSNASAK